MGQEAHRTLTLTRALVSVMKQLMAPKLASGMRGKGRNGLQLTDCLAKVFQGMLYAQLPAAEDRPLLEGK